MKKAATTRPEREAAPTKRKSAGAGGKKVRAKAAQKGTPAAARKGMPGRIGFTATLLRPKAASGGAGGGWLFLVLPKEASAELPSRGMVAVEGTFDRAAFRATLEPDGRGGHWLKVDSALRGMIGKAGGALAAGDVCELEIAPVAAGEEPEPSVPTDVRKALAGAPSAAREAWSDITPAARRDWVQWITSGKRAETRAIRIEKACDMLAKGKRRPCCFDRSGMYSKSLGCPVAEGE